MTFEELKQLFKQPLPGERAHIRFSPMRGSSQKAIESGAPFKLSAVAILLFQQSNEWYTIVTQRQEYNGTHSGQVSFPGGKYEDSDIDTLTTAKREAFEEIGIDMELFEPIGTLSDVYIPVSQFLIKPYVFFSTQEYFDFNASEREVKAIQMLHLEQLFQEDAIALKDIPLHDGKRIPDVPHFIQNELNIWGATALMLNELKFLFKKL